MVSSMDGCAAAADPHVKTGGTARRRRHQTKRADARHVDWLLSLQQSRGAHHTAPIGKRGLASDTLEGRIDALERALALLVSGGAQQAVAPTKGQDDDIRLVARDAGPGEVHRIALQAAAGVERQADEQEELPSRARLGAHDAVPGEVHLIALQASAAVGTVPGEAHLIALQAATAAVEQHAAEPAACGSALVTARADEGKGKKKKTKAKHAPRALGSEDDCLDEAIALARWELAERLSSVGQALLEDQMSCPAQDDHGALLACIGADGACSGCGASLRGEVVAHCPAANCLPEGGEFWHCLRCASPLRSNLLHLGCKL